MPQDIPDEIEGYRLQPMRKGKIVECIHCGEQTEIQLGALNVNLHPFCENCKEVIGIPNEKREFAKIAVEPVSE